VSSRKAALHHRSFVRRPHIRGGFDIPVRDVLKPKVPSNPIDPESTVAEAISRRMVQNNIGSLPVVDSKANWWGIFSERDAIAACIPVVRGSGRSIYEVMTCHP